LARPRYCLSEFFWWFWCGIYCARDAADVPFFLPFFYRRQMGLGLGAGPQNRAEVGRGDRYPQRRELALDHRSGLRSGERASCFFNSNRLELYVFESDRGLPWRIARTDQRTRRRSTTLETRSKLETKMQKRSRTLDSYELEEKIHKKDDQQLKPAPWCNLGYGENDEP
jgi:hypothetical protein